MDFHVRIGKLFEKLSWFSCSTFIIPKCDSFHLFFLYHNVLCVHYNVRFVQCQG